MAKVTAPNLSIKSNGQVGKALVHTQWRGVNVVRSYATPSNPKTAEQTKTRSIFGALSNIWKTMNAAVQAVWTLAAKGQAYTNRNLWISVNLPLLRTETNCARMMASNGAKGGLAPASITVTGAAGKVTVAAEAPDLPTGWTITAFHAMAIKSGDMHTAGFDTTTYYGTDATSPYSVDLTVGAGAYQAFGFFQFAKADGTIAYGPSITGTGTAT